MEERSIRLVAVLSFLAGMAVLGVVWWLGWLEPQEMNSIKGGKGNDGRDLIEGSRAKVQGKIVRIDGNDNVRFIRLSPVSKYPLVSFEHVDASIGDTVEVTGRVKQYKGNLEVVVEKVRKVDDT